MAFLILCVIVMLSDIKDFIENGFSEKAKLKIKGFDRIREIWDCGDVCFHDSVIKSVYYLQTFVQYH